MNVPSEMLLHPELLTNSQLLYVIQQRQLRIPNLESMQRDDLLEVFHHYCVPFGQRKYRDTGRGKLLNKNRQKSPETVRKLNTINSTVEQSRKCSINNINERLNPHPDLLSGHIKRIKLETTFVPLNKDFKDLKRKMEVDKNPEESTPHKKERKPITWP